MDKERPCSRHFRHQSDSALKEMVTLLIVLVCLNPIPPDGGCQQLGGGQGSSTLINSPISHQIGPAIKESSVSLF